MGKSADKSVRSGPMARCTALTGLHVAQLTEFARSGGQWPSIPLSRTSWRLDAEIRGLVQRCLSAFIWLLTVPSVSDNSTATCLEL